MKKTSHTDTCKHEQHDISPKHDCPTYTRKNIKTLIGNHT